MMANDRPLLRPECWAALRLAQPTDYGPLDYMYGQ
jgi:hypothetical protein